MTTKNTHTHSQPDSQDKEGDGCFHVRWTHLGLSQEELQVSSAQDAVVLHVAREVDGAGAVHGAVDLHVAVDEVQVFLLVLRHTRREDVISSHEIGFTLHMKDAADVLEHIGIITASHDPQLTDSDCHKG